MKMDRATGVGLIGLGIAMAVTILAGPFALGLVHFAVSPSMTTQQIGGEVVSLFLAAPIAIIAGVLWLARRPSAVPLASAPALYATYMYVQYIAGPEYDRYAGNSERLFFVHLGLVIVGWAIAARSWSLLGSRPLALPRRLVRISTAAALIALNGLMGLAWVASVADVASGARPAEYVADTTFFWLIRVMDLGFVIPIGLVTALGLVRQASWAARLAQFFIGFQTMLVASVAGMAIAMAVRGDPASSVPLLVITTTLSFVLAALYTGMLIRPTPRRSVSHSRSRPDPRATSGAPAGD